MKWNLKSNLPSSKVFLMSLALGCIPMVSLQAKAEIKDILAENQTTKLIKGKIVDTKGEPLIGVSVVVVGATTGTVTDLDGNFSINVPNDKSQIKVSYIAYKDQIINIANRSVVNITLEENSEALDEVVVVGYGVQKKASLTSAISQIKGEDVFKDRGIGNPTVALQGEVPGLSITRTSTRPGNEGAEMKIRGDISVNGKSSPLILIDGMAGSLDELNSMDANDIENISVLKDASAAIYGARSASGVVLVTTKRGKQGKAQISYNASFSRTINGIQPPITTNKEWLDMFYEAQYNDAAANNPKLTDPKEIHQNINWWIFNSFGGTTIDGNPTTYVGESLFNALREGKSLTLQRGSNIDRWEPDNYMMDYLYGQASSQKHSVSIAGADDKFGYRISLSYSDNNSQLKVAEDGEKKYGARLNMDYQATSQLKIESNISYEKRDIINPSADVGAGYFDPWFWAVYNEKGDAYDTFSGNRNPIGGLTQGGRNKTGFITFRGGMKATYDLSKYLQGLSVSGSGAYKTVEKNFQEQKNKVQYYDWTGNMTGNKQGPGSLKEELEKWENITLGGFVNYQRTFADVHNVSAMLGMTAEEETYKKVGAKRNQGQIYPGSDLTDLDVWVSGTNNEAYGGQNSWGFISYITRLNYNYSDKYLFEFLARRDGSSKLAENQRWKNFYSLSGGWVISNENFMKDIHVLDNLKIRYNYGKTGSVEGIDNYERYARISTGNALFGKDPTNQTSLWLTGMTSDLRTWETINSHNAGLDFGFLRNRLRGSFDYFVKTNTGMFIDVTYPAVLGASAPKTNNGKFRARGWELALNWNDKIGQVRYNFGASLSDAWSTVMELTNNENVPNPGKNENRLVGKPRQAIYVYKTDGIFQTQEEVDAYYAKYYWNADHSGPKSNNIIPAPKEAGTSQLRPGARKVVDLNGDGSITKDDLYYAGDMAPRLMFGFKAGLEWKGIDVQAFFQGVGKQVVLRSGYLAAPWMTNYVLQNNTFLGKMWSENNTNTNYTISSRDQNFNKWNYENKDVLVQNNKYIRLKSLIIGYTLPKHCLTKAGINKVRVYFSGDDLWEWSKVKDGYDPEYGENSNNTFPFSRLLTFGLDVTF